MAGFHPFRSFQKNQKFWLAILGVGTMISFIILPVLMQLFTGVGGPKIEEFGRSRKFGVINEQTIYALSQNRQSLEGFYQILYQQLADPADETRMTGLNYLGRLASQYGQRPNQEELVNNWLLAQYARSQGLNVDQEEVVGFLSQVCGGYLSDKVFQDVLKSVGLNEKRLEYLISNELLASRMRQSFEISMGAVTPATRWDWFQRMNRQVTVEVAAVPVDRFLDKVPEPTDAQLRQFFEKGKDKPYNPMSDESGFIVPNKVGFEYILARPDKARLDSVTDEEIKKYYEENKETRFLKPVRPVGERPSLPGLPGQDNFFSPGLGGFTPGAGRSTPFPTPMTRPAAPATMPTPPAESVPEAKPEAPKPETPEPPKAEEKKEEEKTSSVNRSVRTRFVSYQTETEAAPAAEPKAGEKKEEPKPEPKAEEKKEEPKPEPKVEEKKAEETIDLNILYRPLDEVKDEIREILAAEKAREAMAKVEEKMRDYFQMYNLYVDLDDAGATPPPRPDLAAFAKELGLELVTVGVDTFYGAVKSDFARGMMERERLIQLFMETQLPFDPQNFEGSEGPYLYWVTDVVAESKPEKMEDVRDLVVQQWKEAEARPMAMKQAEELVAEAKAAGKALAETFTGKSDVPVVETEPFLWKTYGQGVSPWMAIMNQIPPQLGEVREKGVAVGDAEIDNKLVFAPGNDFMEAVYALGVGETGVVFNAPKTMVYVVRVTGSTPSEDVLWDRFQLAHLMEYYLAGQPEIAAEGRKAWMEQIYEEIGFKWAKDPDAHYGRR